MTGSTNNISPVHLLNLGFNCFEQLAEAAGGWDLDWQQLDRGRLDATIQRVMSPHVVIDRIAFNRRFLQRGSSPPGLMTFGLVDDAAGEIDWCRRRADAGHLLNFGTAQEYESVSQPGFAGTRVSIEDSHLYQVAQVLEVDLDSAMVSFDPAVLSVDHRVLVGLRKHLHRLSRTISEASGAEIDSWSRNELDFEIPKRIVSALVSGVTTSSDRPSQARIRAARTARDFIDAQAAEPPTILEVCHVSGISWRSLNYAFREIFGMTPKQYLQAVRLNGVRRELRTVPPGFSITNVANNWGFWHMGQFAADYRKHFGELPSETMRPGS